MGELDLNKAEQVASEIENLINTDEFKQESMVKESIQQSETKWVCRICGYAHFGDNPPEQCPVCGVSKQYFEKQ